MTENESKFEISIRYAVTRRQIESPKQKSLLALDYFFYWLNLVEYFSISECLDLIAITKSHNKKN